MLASTSKLICFRVEIRIGLRKFPDREIPIFPGTGIPGNSVLDSRSSGNFNMFENIQRNLIEL